jgi:hypothetical protein
MAGGQSSAAAALQRILFPIIENHAEIASVNMAHESGREILLLHNATAAGSTA